VQSQYQEGAITHGERYNKIIEIWSKVTERVSKKCSKRWRKTTAPAVTSIRFTSWPTPARAARNSGSASSPACAG
jgi:DNA-directed RNA polymerase beta' subunit